MESYATCIMRARPLTICERVYCIRRTGGRTRDRGFGDDGCEAKCVCLAQCIARSKRSRAQREEGEGSERGRKRKGKGEEMV